MPGRNFIFILFFFAKFHSFEGCGTNKNKVKLACKEYDLDKPFKLKLGDALTEISGINFYSKDSSVFAISNNNGNLYKIHFNRNFLTEEWRFDKTHDFEEVIFHDTNFYILESNGNIETLHFSAKGDTIFNRKSKFPRAGKKKNEFESIYYDELYHGLIMICKDCDDEKKGRISAWTFNPLNDTYARSQFSIDVKTIEEKSGQAKIELKPSAATINPVTKDVWILASENQLLIVTDRKGNTKNVYTLDPVIFNQPEGITFTPWGDLLISNEAGDKYSNASILIFKPKKRV